jgi:hypothetical protein
MFKAMNPDENRQGRHASVFQMCSWLAACVAVLLAVAPLRAQAPGNGAERGKTQDAATVEAQAKALHDQPKQYRRAAELYVQASDLREASDPQRVENRKMAARLYFLSGNVARARVVMEDAANTALAAGNLVQAAHTYLDASVLARDDRAPGDANRLAQKAELLMASPLVSDAERKDVLGRIVKK